MWNDLSMADRAKYIQLAVQNGITNIDNIRGIYNKYAEGGYKGDKNHPIQLEEVIVTPQSSALNRSREATSPNIDFSHAQDMTRTQRFGANWLAGVPFIGVDPHTCLNTVTGFYDPENTVASNPNIVANPEDYGYRKIEQKDAIPGDLIILSNGEGHPKHAVMFDSVAEGYGVHNGFNYAPGDTLVNYSNGGRDTNDYRLQGPLPRFDDPDKAGGDFSGPRTYLRFTGKNKKKYYKSNIYAEGGNTNTTNSNEYPEKNIIDNTEDTKPGFFENLASGASELYNKTKDIANNVIKNVTYGIMVDSDGGVSGSDKTISEIIDGINFSNARAADREYVPRNLASLYIYGNDLGQFKEDPTLRDLGVDYNKYLKSIGRDSNKVKTYRGVLPVIATLPEGIKDYLPEHIRSTKNKTYGNNMDHIVKDVYSDTGIVPDDVAGFLQRLDLDSNGNPIIVNSDLWDFEPKSYYERYKEGNPLLYLKASALDKVGTPFILKDTYPVQFTDIDTFYDNYDKRNIGNKIARDFGYLPEVIVYGDKE